VDLLYAAFWLAALAAAVLYDRTGRLADLLFFALAFGLALGSKSTAYLQAPLLLLPAWTLWRRPELRGKAARSAPLLLAAATALGGYTYLRNWAAYGNPLYPFEFRVGGLTVFSGILNPEDLFVRVEDWFVPGPAAWLWYPFRESLKGVVTYSTENGFGPLFAGAWAALPAAAWAAWRGRNRAVLGVLGVFLASLAAFFLLQPTREPRYAIFLAGPPMLLAAFALRRMRGRLRLAAQTAWSAAVLASVVACLGWLGSETGFAESWAEIRRGGGADPRAYYSRRYGALGDAWAALNERLAPGDVVAVNYAELLLPWAGTPARGDVRVVGRRESLYPETYWAQSDEDWVALLDGIRARYLALFSPRWYPEEGSAERSSISRSRGRFRLLGSWQDPAWGRMEIHEFLPQDCVSRPHALECMPKTAKEER
jgi:hypothetical protein